MELINVVVAGLASFGFGAVWYMSLSKPWLAASGVAVDPDTGQPANASNPVPYVTSLIASIMVAGMMRHVFELSAIDTIAKGAMSGFGIGLFLITPWIATFYAFNNKPRALLLIDGGYATIGCSLIGIVLMLF